MCSCRESDLCNICLLSVERTSFKCWCCVRALGGSHHFNLTFRWIVHSEDFDRKKKIGTVNSHSWEWRSYLCWTFTITHLESFARNINLENLVICAKQHHSHFMVISYMPANFGSTSLKMSFSYISVKFDLVVNKFELLCSFFAIYQLDGSKLSMWSCF